MSGRGVELEGKNVHIYFLDFSGDTIGKKTGYCVKDSENKILIQNTRGFLECIPYCRVVRVVETGREA